MRVMYENECEARMVYQSGQAGKAGERGES